jgi:hypothetical protein
MTVKRLRRQRFVELQSKYPDATPDSITDVLDEEFGLDFDDPWYV